MEVVIAKVPKVPQLRCLCTSLDAAAKTKTLCGSSFFPIVQFRLGSVALDPLVTCVPCAPPVVRGPVVVASRDES